MNVNGGNVNERSGGRYGKRYGHLVDGRFELILSFMGASLIAWCNRSSRLISRGTRMAVTMESNNLRSSVDLLEN